MKHTDIIETLETTDQWTQLSCLGSMHYAVSAEVIRRAAKLMPNHNIPGAIEEFLNEERNLKLDATHAGPDENGELVALTTSADVATTPGNYLDQRRELQALLALRIDLSDRSDMLAANAGAQENSSDRSLTNTLAFMTQRRADAVFFARQYTTNMRLGVKNYGQTRAQYVEQEMIRAARDSDDLLAKGEIAIQYLEGLDPRDGEISERVVEQMAKRCVAKLIARRIKLGQSLSWRTNIDERSSIEADIQFIEEAIEELGGDIPPEAIALPEAMEEVVQQVPTGIDYEKLARTMQEIAIGFKPNPKAPGPVTITRQ